MYQSTVKHFITQFLIVALFICTTATLTSAQRIEKADPSVSNLAADNMTPPCQDVKLSTTGNSGTTGSSGNIRTFGAGGVNVKASAFSKSGTSWQTAYLGAYGPGLGVTNSTEDGTASSHKVDNVGTRKDYVLFEFDQDVIIDQVYLDSVDDDSDITVWIGSGTDPYNNHLTLSDTLLTSFGPSEANNGGNSSRWANINSAGKAGNVLVVAAAVGGTNDAFKIGELALDCAGSNRATVTIIKEVFTFDGGTAATQQFAFSATGMATSGFNLVDMNVTGPDRFIDANITSFGAAHPITVTELSTASWTLLDLACVETGGIQNSSVNFAQRKATIIAEAGESIVCTFKNTQLTPSAAHTIISGRAVTVNGRGISGAMLTLTDVVSGESRYARTNPFGYYIFDDVEVGQFYILNIRDKRYTFSADTVSFTLIDELTSLDFVEAL